MRRGAALALGCLAVLLAAVALAQQLAFPPLTGRVVDEAGILDAALEQRLSRDLEAHERASGDQVVVATLRSLQGTTVEDFANRLYRHWKLGQAKEDDGALLVVAPTERKVRIEAGYGLEGVLTDAASSTIVQSLVLPRFRAGDIPGGVEAGARGILELLRPEDGAASPQQAPGWTGQPRPQQATGGPSWILVLLAFLCLIMLARAFNRSRPRQHSNSPRNPWGRVPYRRGYGLPPVIVLPGGFGRGDGGGFGGGFGGGGGGGGFSGGGGSSGGGGASGSW